MFHPNQDMDHKEYAFLCNGPSRAWEIVDMVIEYNALEMCGIETGASELDVGPSVYYHGNLYVSILSEYGDASAWLKLHYPNLVNDGTTMWPYNKPQDWATAPCVQEDSPGLDELQRESFCVLRPYANWLRHEKNTKLECLRGQLHVLMEKGGGVY